MDPYIQTYETSYLPEETVNLPDLNQQIRIHFKEKEQYVDGPDPRALFV